MDLDILIIGQGICGTFLSWYLQKENASFAVIDESRPFSASRSAAGLISPITGRRLVKTWMIDEILPFVQEEYREIGRWLGIDCLSKKSIVDFFPSPQMRLAFLNRYEEDPSYLKKPGEESGWQDIFQYDFGYGRIEPSFLVDLSGLVFSYRSRLLQEGKLLEERFEPAEMVYREGGIEYRSFLAGRIIFCDGIESSRNPYFKNLPFAPNKGEALVLEIPDLPPGDIFKKGMTLVPWQAGMYWMGSSYEWDFKDDQPSAGFRERTSILLKEWLKIPFRIVDHLASVRPATLERRPFVGFHPRFPRIGILNGMGTKGCSLSPYFARQLAGYIGRASPIQADADIQRFSGLLSRPHFKE
jgi:glycine/D-amino acid oxidase-like deaminating enzyme